MVHVQRLTYSTMLVASCVIMIFSICTMCYAEAAGINNNLVREHVELGNQYNEASITRKYPDQHRPPLPYSSHHHQHHRSHAVTELNGRNDHDSNARVQSKHVDIPDNKEEESCLLCAAARENHKIDDDTLRALRIEMVKKQILEKLRFKEPPKMDHIPKAHETNIPTIALGHPAFSKNSRNEHDDNDDVENLDLEDFYGKPEQTIVLPQDELADCSSWSISSKSEAASCFIFKLPKEVRSNQISSAELWIYQLSDSRARKHASSAESESSATMHLNDFSISEMVTISNYRVGSSNKRRGSPHFNTIVERQNISEAAEWINFNITEKARKWLITDVNEHEHTIKISCSSCSLDLNAFPFGTTGEQQPFIVFNLSTGRKRRRHRRSVNCSPGVTECCRESLYVSFEEIKWDWILEPKGFDAYYCKGSCLGDLAVTHTTTHHSRIMIDLVKGLGVNNITADLVPCCTATEMSSVSLLYRDPQSSNTTYQHVKLPNMVVQRCGCK